MEGSYKVEILQDNEWFIHSWHKNLENAAINYDVQEKNGKTCRIIYHGQIITRPKEV
jgi:hypothetical protein